ncbi:cupin domain-containing protein [Falsirhodobacter xinxiangensis]|uniref:cupin domain-containing protein n=1 Tax=Falsirhodobacter xinxiangensis TaxID=2530049 RepID=UPI0010AB32D3|nr:cupin domain-containing protein [Rhodobacter xinxiangensis]
MSLLHRIEPTPAFAPREDLPAPDRLVEGSPSFKTWPLDESNGTWTQTRTGIWEATPGTTRSIKGEAFEFCHLLEGEVEITEEGGEMQRFVAGDSFVMKPGFVGLWKTIRTVRKIYVFAS